MRRHIQKGFLILLAVDICKIFTQRLQQVQGSNMTVYEYTTPAGR